MLSKPDDVAERSKGKFPSSLEKIRLLEIRTYLSLKRCTQVIYPFIPSGLTIAVSQEARVQISPSSNYPFARRYAIDYGKS